MPLYPLGISRRRDVPSVPQQAAGSIDVCWSLAGELACAFIDGPHRAVPPMLHATVLDAIHRRICVLPVRFGVALGDEAEIHALLNGRQRELLDQLHRLDCTCEMGVQMAPEGGGRRVEGGTENENGERKRETEDQESARKGGAAGPCLRPPLSRSSPLQPALAYLEGRRCYYRRSDEHAEEDHRIVQQFAEQLQGFYRQWRRLSSSPSQRIRLAFLVERDRVTAFQSRAKNAGGICPKGQLVVLGPWPPYSFVESLAERLDANIASL